MAGDERLAYAMALATARQKICLAMSRSNLFVSSVSVVVCRRRRGVWILDVNFQNRWLFMSPAKFQMTQHSNGPKQVVRLIKG